MTGYMTKEPFFFALYQGGYRSMMAASILQARGFRNFKKLEEWF
jgi:rhodanese-related sulfurtransferase